MDEGTPKVIAFPMTLFYYWNLFGPWSKGGGATDTPINNHRIWCSGGAGSTTGPKPLRPTTLNEEECPCTI